MRGITPQFLPTLNYLFAFACGASLALCRERIKRHIRSAKRAYASAILGTIAYAVAVTVGRDVSHSDHFLEEFVADWIVIFGVLGIMASTFPEN